MSLAHMPNSYAERIASEPRRTNHNQSGVEAEASVKLYVGTMVVGFDKARIDQLLRLPKE